MEIFIDFDKIFLRYFLRYFEKFLFFIARLISGLKMVGEVLLSIAGSQIWK
jgi:hypothetical protein